MTKERNKIKQPSPKPSIDRNLIPILSPDTTEIVANAVITQMIATFTVVGSLAGSIQPSSFIPAASCTESCIEWGVKVSRELSNEAVAREESLVI